MSKVGVEEQFLDESLYEFSVEFDRQVRAMTAFVPSVLFIWRSAFIGIKKGIAIMAVRAPVPVPVETGAEEFTSHHHGEENDRKVIYASTIFVCEDDGNCQDKSNSGVEAEWSTGLSHGSLPRPAWISVS